MLYITFSEALPQENVLFPEAVNDDPGPWSLFVHLAQDTRCRRCRGRGETG